MGFASATPHSLLPGLKRAFVREAAGDTGTLPRLLRGEPV